VDHKITMNAARLLAALLFAGSLTACVSTERFASEYGQHYVLAEDVHLYKGASFTGFSSAWFTGPESVETICSAKRPVRGATTIKKGSPVKVLKIIRVAGIDASSCEAKLEVFDRETHVTHVVYIRWPGSKSLLRMETRGDGQ
jgi:hypothetical protein